MSYVEGVPVGLSLLQGYLVWISSRQPSKIKTGLTHTNLVRLKLKPSEFDNFFSESIIVFQFVHCNVIIPFCLESSVLLLLLMTHRSNCFPYHFSTTDWTTFLEKNAVD